MAALASAAVVVLMFALAAQTTTASPPRLQFNSNGKFKLLIFTDQHFGENAWDTWGPQQDVDSTTVMNTVLDLEKPDFVIYLGDQITANNLMNTNGSLYWEKVVEPTRSRGIPWASVLGNHDTAPFQWDSTWFGPNGIPTPYDIPEDMHYGGGSFGARRKLLDMGVTSAYDQYHEELSNPLSLSKAGPKHLWPSTSNFHVALHPSSGKGKAAVFYFLDSGGGFYDGVVTYAQAQWLNRTMRAVNPHGKPELLFVHIPPIAYNDVLPNVTTPNIGGFVPPPCIGNLATEGDGTQNAEWGLIDVMTNRTSLLASFSGHDHGNDWCCPYQNALWLCHARHSGYGGYNRGWLRGSKVLEFRETPFRVRQWVRLEDGTAIGHGTLENLRQ